MKVTVNGKIYDTDKCEALGSYSHRNYKNDCCGVTYLLRDNDGLLLEYTCINGKDLFVSSRVVVYLGDIREFNFDTELAARCAELGLLKIV